MIVVGVEFVEENGEKNAQTTQSSLTIFDAYFYFFDLLFQHSLISASTLLCQHRWHSVH